MAEHKLPESHEYSISEKLASQNTTTIFLFLFFFFRQSEILSWPFGKNRSQPVAQKTINQWDYENLF